MENKISIIKMTNFYPESGGMTIFGKSPCLVMQAFLCCTTFYILIMSALLKLSFFRVYDVITLVSIDEVFSKTSIFLTQVLKSVSNVLSPRL